MNRRIKKGTVHHPAGLSVKSEDDLLALLETAKKPPLLLILDCVQDPHNLGACIRSADAAGGMAVVIPRDRAAPLTETVRSVSRGASDNLPVVQVTNLARTMDKLKQAGIWLAGSTDDAEKTIYETDLSGPLAIVMGSEGDGLRRLTREKCDFLVRIPMFGSVECLNVSVAAGVCLFEAIRQRNLRK